MTSKSKSKSKNNSSLKERAKEQKSYLKHAVIVLSALGFVLSAYLTYIHFAEAQAAFCSEGSKCDQVRQSSFGTVLGIPVAMLGVLGYASIIAVTLVSISKKRRWLLLYILALGGVTFSAYLTYVELFVIHAICMYCVISAILMTAIFLIVLFGKQALYPKFSGGKTIALGFFVVLVVLMGAYSLQYEQLAEARLPSYEVTPADGYTVSLAKYLGSSGAVMFGSYKCPHCNEQKKMFRSAFKYINYVECHPKGPDANPSLCFAKGVQNFPTWEIQGQYYQGAMPLDTLSDLSGFEKTGQ